MTKGILFFFLSCPLIIAAQPKLDVGIFNSPVGSDKLEIRIKPDQTINNGVYSSGVFTVRFLSVYGVTISAPPGLNNSLYRYTLSNQGTDALYSYYSFSFVNIYNVNWNNGIEYPIAILQINQGCGSGNGTFEILNNTWTAANNGDYYQEVDGNETQNIFYQPSTIAPLGVGMVDMTPPTISCTGNKTVGTQLNVCRHTNLGTSWDAIGSDNCPGFTIEYILSGVTIDTLFTLANTVFNKGLTIVNVTITDIAGYTDTCSFTVTVNDIQAPTLTAPPPKIVFANSSSCTATGIDLGIPNLNDNCPGAILSNNAPPIFPFGATTVIWTVTDEAGLSTTATQTVTVQTGLHASGLNLSSHRICNADIVNVSIVISGGFGPYKVVYSANGMPNTITGYTSNDPIPISPFLSTRYKLISVTDSIGCTVTPILSDSLTVLPKPILGSLSPSAANVCLGDPVAFTAYGLLPNDTTIFNFTLTPGGGGAVTGVTTTTGTFTFNPSFNPIGMYGMSISSITVNGCTTNFNTGNSGAYSVNPFPTIGEIRPSSEIVCAGTSVHILINGLPPDLSLTLNYIINGVSGIETILTNSTGSGILLSAIYPVGNYSVVVTSVTAAGCSLSTNLSASFSVDPFQAMCGFTVGGRLATETNKGVEEANVPISGFSNGNPFSYSDLTDTSGTFSFVNTIPLASDYLIKPLKNDNPINGLTTYDLVLISKHILGISPLNTPYKIIAADANKSNSISTFDIVEFRKLILGIYQYLPNNTSWRFVDKDYVFPALNNPFNPLFPESINRTNVQLSASEEDFVAVKIGDLDGSVVLNSSPNSEDRSPRKTLLFDIVSNVITDKIQKGETFQVSFEPLEPNGGYQFTLDITGLEILYITPGEGMDLQNFGIFEDAVTTSFAPQKPGQSGVFSITFRAKSAGRLSQMLAISSRITFAGAYSNTEELVKMNVGLRFFGIQLEEQAFKLYQNHPNPFTGHTLIPFYLPISDLVKLTIFDPLGAVLYTAENRFEAGQNNFNVIGALLPCNALLYYKVESSSASSTKKMLKN